jgi:hypothetical protein
MWTGPHQAGSGHVSTPDPYLSKAWVFSAPESRNPVVGSPDPTRGGGGSGTCPGVWDALVGVLDLARRSGLHVQGSGTFPMGGSDLLLTSWSISSSLATW